MMKISYKILIFLMMIFCFSFVSYAVPVEDIHDEMTKSEVFTKIDDEHKNTRKYFTDEMNRQRTQFYKEIDDRGIYYENEFKKMLLETYTRLGLIWAGVVLFAISLSHILKLKTERMRYNSLKKNLVEELRKDLNLVVIRDEVNSMIEKKVDSEIIKGIQTHSWDVLSEKAKEDKVNEDLVLEKDRKSKMKYIEKKHKKSESKELKLSDDIRI